MPSRSIIFKATLLLLAAGCIAAILVAARNPSAFRSTDRAYYLDEKTAAFVRPGLDMKVTKAEIATDGTIRAWVKLTDPRGLPLDRLGLQTPGPVSVSFLIAYIPANGTQHVSYITRQRTSGGNTATQATGESNGTWAQVAEGEYVYTFANKAPASADRNATHTVAIYGSRNLTEFDLGTFRADGWLDFVPSGTAVTKVRDVVRSATCNNCHDQLAFHGGNRRSIQVCVICHTPQSTEPATGNTLDMKVMTHKIHMGSSLPSVVAGGKYAIANVDYSDIVNPSPNTDCAVCHQPKEVSGAAQADNWLNKPSREACGSCHETVNFATGQGHAAGPFTSDERCSQCHTATANNDFDASVPGAHTVPQRSSLLQGLVTKIEKVEEVAPGKKPVVTFSIVDKTGAPIAPSQLSTMRLYMGGPTTDIGSYVREDARGAADVGGGRFAYTFTATVPAAATSGSWQFGIEAYRTVTLLAGTTKQRSVREAGTFSVVAVSADGRPVKERRSPVSTAKCKTCHTQFGFHGGNRNTTQSCTFCHTPTLVEDGESWNFPNFIHRLHADEVRYPGNIARCSQCHEGDSSSLPLEDTAKPTVNGHAPITPTPPVTNACLSCHNTPTAWAHAATNLSPIGESCAVCHGPSAQHSVARSHAQ